MSENGKSFGWIIKHYDRALVMLALVAVTVSAIVLSVRTSYDYKELELGASFDRQQAGKPVAPLDVAKWQEREQLRAEPFQTQPASNRTLISELRVRCANEDCQKPIPYDAANCPFCQFEQPHGDIVKVDSDGDGIPDELELLYDMDPFDPTDAQRDLDGDGFTAREEFSTDRMVWLSDPTDPASYPPPHVRLRWARITATPFAIQFRGVQELPDENRYQLNLGGSSRFARMGEELAVRTDDGTTRIFKVTDYEELYEQVGNRREDVSTVTLESDGQFFTLVKNVVVQREDREAWMVFLINMKRVKARIGDEFSLLDYRYKVVDIDRDSVLVTIVEKPEEGLFVELDADEEFRVERITDEEMNALRKAATVE